MEKKHEAQRENQTGSSWQVTCHCEVGRVLFFRGRFFFCSFLKFGPNFWDGSEKQRKRVAGEETWSDERRRRKEGDWSERSDGPCS